ncbi:hypothetical protein JMJ35_009843 [Cladonia borealis]|uniref:Uncharacterized protein n=1 Tax=Cladonia borealis TaxID=184061 RepID=A0AA39QT74_9LECA|nr:hypothetical protein JMJ35_009843 [Cladonia borealis]
MNYPFIKQEALGLAKKNQRTTLRPYHAPVDDTPLSIAIPTDQAQGYLHSDKVSPREAHWHRIMTPMPSQTLLGDLLLASKTPVQNEFPQEISRKRHAEDEMQDVNPAVSEVTDFPLKTSKRRRSTSNAQAENKPSDQPLLPGGNQPHLKEVGKDLQDLRAQIQHLRLVSAKENEAQATMITNLLTLASVVEIAVDVREAELRTSLSNISGTADQIKEQAAQLVDFSSGTSWLITSLVRSAMKRHHTYLEDEEQQEIHRRLYEDAAPSEEDAAIIDEQLPLIDCGFGVE